MKRLAGWSKNFGPGIIMASSCVGGSHIIASTQAGAYYGYQLAGLIVAVNLLKYPFFRFAFDYSAQENKSVLQGYAEKSRAYLWLFLAFNLFATMVNIAGGTLLSSVLLAMLLPALPLNLLNIAVLLSFLLILFFRQYQRLDQCSKAIMLLLSLTTFAALLAAYPQTTTPPAGFTPPSPWRLEAVPLLIALMGWMPAPMELSVAGSLWVLEKSRHSPAYRQQRRLDFNSGYLATIVLALMFMTLGAWVLHGQPIPPLSGGQFIHQFVDMYAHSIGEWTRGLMVLVAFGCIYGTTLVAVDGYSRCNQQAVSLLRHPSAAPNPSHQERSLRGWMIFATLAAFVVIQFFSNAVGYMIVFAMSASFVSAPVFAWLNFKLAGQQPGGHPIWLWLLAYLGLLYLVAMVVLYFIPT